MNPWCGQYFCVITAHDRYKSYYAHSGKINYTFKKQSYLPLKDTSGQSLMLNSPHPAGCIFKNSKYLSHHDHYLYFFISHNPDSVYTVLECRTADCKVSGRIRSYRQ